MVKHGKTMWALLMEGWPGPLLSENRPCFDPGKHLRAKQSGRCLIMNHHEPEASDFKWQPDSRDNIIQWFCTWWLIPRNVSGLVHPSFLSGLTRSKNPM